MNKGQNIPVLEARNLSVSFRMYDGTFKQKELRVFGIVPLVNLGTYGQPHPFPVKFLRHLVGSLKPIMAVLPIPVHLLAVKIFPFCHIRPCLPGADIISFFVFPIVNGKLLFYFQFF